MTLGITEVILTGFTSSTLHSTAALKHGIRNPETETETETETEDGIKYQ